jgi:16S rRNA (cytosine967-C5)-methyltransferase
MKFDNQLRYAVKMIADYRGDTPLHSWLKDFFREHRQMGSKDRKLAGAMVYGFYRLGHAVKNIPVEERLMTGLFLCHDTPNDLLDYFKPGWKGHHALPIEEKISLCRSSGIDFRVNDIFPWIDELSEGVDHIAFCLSFLRQPDLFLRIRPGYEKEVLAKIAEKQTAAGFIPPFTLRLPNGFKVEDLFTPDKEIVVQDYSSQRIAPFLQMTRNAEPGDSVSANPLRIWDACAASGGKSILAYDLNPQTEITVSDIRESILHNLRRRFRHAGIHKYCSFTADLRTSAPAAAREGGSVQYDLVIADLPCTGSGTWSRNPEELYFFHPGKIAAYRDLQKEIIAHMVPSVSRQGCLVYCTCSVFKKENEEMTGWIGATFGGRIEKQELINGTKEAADSMFAARFVC